jgi:hypothetical protein
MGGNQAMCDAGKLLTRITRLAELAKSKNGLPRAEIEKSVTEFEAEMIPRAFEWVKKSGGDDFVVSRIYFGNQIGNTNEFA